MPRDTPSSDSLISSDEPPIIEFKPTGAIVCPGLSFEEWQERWASALQVEQGSRWWLGDVLAYGEDWFSEQWSQVLDPKFAEHHRGVMRVSRRIPFANRRESLSWSCHRAAASGETIEERIELLDMAEANNWDSRAIAAEARRRREIRRGNGGPALDDTSVTESSGNVFDDLGIPDPRSTWNESSTFGSPQEIDGKPVLLTLGGAGITETDHRPPDTPPSPEAIRAAIAAIRRVSNEIALSRHEASEVIAVAAQVSRCFGRADDANGRRLTWAEAAMELIPAPWVGKMVVEFGERVFGGRTFAVSLTRPGGKQAAIGVCPTLACAIVEAALAALLSDRGAG